MIDEKEIFEHAQEKVKTLREREKVLIDEHNKVQAERIRWENVVVAFHPLNLKNDAPASQATIENKSQEGKISLTLLESVIEVLKKRGHPMGGTEIYADLQNEYGYSSVYPSLSGRLRKFVELGDLAEYVAPNQPKSSRYWYLLPNWVGPDKKLEQPYMNHIKRMLK